jgi:hypothetical protein
VIRRPTALLTAVAVAAAIPLAGCGGGGDEKTIPHDDGAKLIRILHKARDAAGDPAKCDTLQSAVRQAKAQVDSLPSSVDSDTRQSLDNGVANLADRARQDCANVQTTTTPTTTTPTVSTPTVTPPPTETAPPTNTTPTTPTTPPTNTEPTTPQTQPPPQTVPGQGNGGSPPGQGKGKGPKDTQGQDKKGVKPGKEPKGPKK